MIVDFSRLAGTTVTLTNSAKTPYPAGESPDPRTTGQVLQFRVVKPLQKGDKSVIPAAPRPLERLSAADAAVTRTIELAEMLDPLTLLPTMLMLEGKGWHEDVTLTPTLGSTELWRFVNTTADTHPMHVHLVQFQVVSRQTFDTRVYASTGSVKLNGVPKRPPPQEQGWKDTVQVDPGEVVTITGPSTGSAATRSTATSSSTRRTT